MCLKSTGKEAQICSIRPGPPVEEPTIIIFFKSFELDALLGVVFSLVTGARLRSLTIGFANLLFNRLKGILLMAVTFSTISS